MKDRDIRKDLGCSWIEFYGEIYEFFVEDELYFNVKNINLMLKEVFDKLKFIGY